MPSSVQPRKIIINGHPTSIRLEPEFWYWLRQIAAECGTTATKLIEGIVIAKNPHRPLSSALRVYIAGYFHGSAPRYGLRPVEIYREFITAAARWMMAAKL